jgi:hypothetical protein
MRAGWLLGAMLEMQSKQSKFVADDKANLESARPPKLQISGSADDAMVIVVLARCTVFFETSYHESHIFVRRFRGGTLISRLATMV